MALCFLQGKVSIKVSNDGQMFSSVDEVSNRAQAHTTCGMGSPMCTFSMVKEVPCVTIVHLSCALLHILDVGFSPVVCLRVLDTRCPQQALAASKGLQGREPTPLLHSFR